jgi:hypothetical protein
MIADGTGGIRHGATSPPARCTRSPRFAGSVPASDGIAEIISAAAGDAGLARAIVDIWSRARAP